MINNNDNDTSKKFNKRLKTLKPVPLVDGIEEIRQDFEERIEKGDTVYGIEILDDCVETIRKGSVTFIVAAPNVGKSMWGLKIATNLAKQGKRVLINSCEMGAGLLMERELRKYCDISMSELKRLYEERRDVANKIMDSFIEDKTYSYLRNIDICETGGASVDDILDMLDCFPEYEFIIVDYIQRIRGAGTEYDNITHAAREIQTYARQTGRKFIVCSQANRQSNLDAVGRKQEMDPTKIRGKGSGSIEEDADVGLSLMEINDEIGKHILATLFKNRYSPRKNITYKYRIDSRLNFIVENKGV